MVKINNTFMIEEEISYGIPQGVVIGRILFTLYISSLLAITCDRSFFSKYRDRLV